MKWETRTLSNDPLILLFLVCVFSFCSIFKEHENKKTWRVTQYLCFSKSPNKKKKKRKEKRETRNIRIFKQSHFFVFKLHLIFTYLIPFLSFSPYVSCGSRYWIIYFSVHDTKKFFFIPPMLLSLNMHSNVAHKIIASIFQTWTKLKNLYHIIY